MTEHDDDKNEDDAAFDTLSDNRALEDEERPHEESPNPTQQRIDEDPEADKPADAPWSS